MSEREEFDALLTRLRTGDDGAAAEICDRFGDRLLGLARGRLGGRARARVDPEEVVQSALASFFRRNEDGGFELADWDSLWRLLVKVTVRKCGRRLRHAFAAQRDARREVSVAALADASDAAHQPASRDPTPVETAALNETIERLLASLPDDRHKLALILRLQGHQIAEISREVNLSERTLHRVLSEIKTRLETWRDRDEK